MPKGFFLFPSRLTEIFKVTILSMNRIEQSKPLIRQIGESNMRNISVAILLFASIAIAGCGGVADGGFGTVSMNITDAKPMLPSGTKNLWITFDEVLAHKAGGGWESLPLPESPYTIDLLQFYDGKVTEFVPPVSLESGKYTQLRFFVSRAMIRIDDGTNVSDYEVTIPSDKLRTDKNFDFTVEDGGSVDITVDFDLSQSIVVTDISGVLSYKLKPVLHIVETSDAATISGMIDYGSFVDSKDAILTVFVFNTEIGLYEEYTKLVVSPVTESLAEFVIFWLVPNKDYRVEIDFDFDPEAIDNNPEWCENVSADDLGPGSVFPLDLEPPLVCQD